MNSYKWLMILLTLAVATTAQAKPILTTVERKKGNEAIEKLAKDLSKADAEDKRAYHLLKTDPDYYYAWCRSIADQKDPKKMKALIRVSRKHKLWHTVDWLLEELEALEPKSVSHYHLKALSFFERGDTDEALSILASGLRDFPFERRLRRTHYKLKKAHRMSTNIRTLTNIFNFEEIVDMVLCHRRSEALTDGMRDFIERYPRRKASFKPKNLLPETRHLWEKELKLEKLIPTAYAFGGPCKYYSGTRGVKDDNRLFAVCTKHFHNEFIEKGEPYSIPFENWLVEPKVLEQALASKKAELAVLALEKVLKRPTRMSSKHSKRLGELLLASHISKYLRILLLRKLAHYVRRYHIKEQQTLEAVKEVAMKNRGQIRSLACLILRWHKMEFPKLNDRELAHILSGDNPMGMLPRDDDWFDRRQMAREIVKEFGSDAKKRLRGVVESNQELRAHYEASCVLPVEEAPADEEDTEETTSDEGDFELPSF